MHEVKAKGILSAQNGMSIYRGCTHGCIYCDARSSCYQMDHAFVDIEVKTNATPILPFINDTEENIQGLLDECRKAGVYGIMNFGIGVTLWDGDRQYFYRKLDEHFPGMIERYIQTYGNAYELPVPKEKELMRLMRQECEKNGIEWRSETLFEYMHRIEDKQAGEQLSLFDR